MTTKTWKCGFCQVGNHRYCPILIKRPKDQIVLCSCDRQDVNHPYRDEKADGRPSEPDNATSGDAR